MKSVTNQVVNLPSKKIMTDYFKGQILASSILSKKLQDSHVLKYIHSTSIISLGKLYDDRCTAIIDQKIVCLVKFDNFLLSGKRNQMDWLWGTPLTAPVLSLSTVQLFQS